MSLMARWSGLVGILASCGLTLACGEVRKSGNPDGGGGGDDGNGSNDMCEASSALRCDGDVLVSCNDEGTAEVQTPCELRCDATALTCKDNVDPSNGFAAQLDAAAAEPALNVTQQTSVNVASDFNASAGTLKVGSQQVKAALVPGANGAPDVLVVSVNSLSIAPNVVLDFNTTSGMWRALAIMSAGDVSIAGTIKVGPIVQLAGNDPCKGAASSAAGADNDYPGGGGGGFAQPGGNGGSVTGVGNGAQGGTATGNPTLIPLRGGCPGGTNPFGGGGPGGGAIQITSASQITISGAIGAPGYGGIAGGGGGAGGGILLEAPVVSVTGGVFANGGGGACGNYNPVSQGMEGTFSTTPALGDQCPNGRRGGNGGAGTTPPLNGDSVGNASGTQDYAAGGGGGVGRIRINTLDMTIQGTGAQSPPASLGIIGTR